MNLCNISIIHGDSKYNRVIFPSMFGICLKHVEPWPWTHSPAPQREVGDATRAQAYLEALHEDVGDVKLVSCGIHPFWKWWLGDGVWNWVHQIHWKYCWRCRRLKNHLGLINSINISTFENTDCLSQSGCQESNTKPRPRRSGLDLPRNLVHWDKERGRPPAHVTLKLDKHIPHAP